MYQRFKVRERPVPPQAPQEHLMKKAHAPTSHSLEENESNPIMEFQGGLHHQRGCQDSGHAPPDST